MQTILGAWAEGAEDSIARRNQAVAVARKLDDGPDRLHQSHGALLFERDQHLAKGADDMGNEAALFEVSFIHIGLGLFLQLRDSLAEEPSQSIQRQLLGFDNSRNHDDVAMIMIAAVTEVDQVARSEFARFGTVVAQLGFGHIRD